MNGNRGNPGDTALLSAHPLAERLLHLKRGVEAVNRARNTTNTVAMAPPRQAATPFPSTNGREVMLKKVAAGLHQYAGFQNSSGLLSKVENIFAGLNDAELGQEVNFLMACPPKAAIALGSPNALAATLSRTATAGDDLLSWQSLAEKVVVHETYFYRDTQQYDRIEGEILPALVARESKSHYPRIRIWSAAVSTGEEAYTLAMLTLLALFETGNAKERADGEIIPDSRWSIQIIGTDISKRVLQRAKTGIYYQSGRLNSFREFPVKLNRFIDFGKPHVSLGDKTEVAAPFAA